MLDVAFDSSPTGLVVCDEAGRILRVNRVGEALFGYRAVELVGSPLEMLLPSLSTGDEAGGESGPWSPQRPVRPGALRQLLGRRRDGTEFPVDVGLSFSNRDGMRLAIASFSDATDRVRRLTELGDEARERIAFERLLTNVVAQFARIEHDQVDATLTESLRMVAQVLDLDRAVVWQFTEDGEDMVFTHAWISPLFAPAPARVSTRELFPWLLSKARASEAVWSATLDDVPSLQDRENLRAFDTRSNAVIPLGVDGRVLGALSFATLRAERPWPLELRDRLQLLASVFAQALARRRSHERVLVMLAENEQLRMQLERENKVLRRELSAERGSRVIAAESAAARAVLAQIEQVAATDATVLLLGETGTGKEVFAQALHDLSRRRDRPMVRVNCAAIPAALVESELFGRERGAYTGALSRQVGRFELAHGSTLFLDEIGDLPLESQVKLLRVTQDRVIERLGGTKPIQVDVRLVAATNRDLSRAVADRTFREDLFHRLNVFPIKVPPLRERLEDIPVLAWTFIEEFSNSVGRRVESISKQSLEALQRYPWPGNVRELRNVIERAMIQATGPHLELELPPIASSRDESDATLLSLQAEHIRSVLQRTGWRVRGSGGAAEVLGMKPTTLDSLMARLGIRRPGR